MDLENHLRKATTGDLAFSSEGLGKWNHKRNNSRCIIDIVQSGNSVRVQAEKLAPGTKGFFLCTGH